MKYKDYYKTLGINKNASQDEIRKAFRRLARKYHPDVSNETDAEKKFKDLNEAYEVLKDTEKRQAYDALGPNWKNGQHFDPPPGWDFYRDFDAGRHTSGAGASFSDFFENLFGRQFNATGFSHTRSKPTEQDIGTIQISLEEAYHGTRRQLDLQEPVFEAKGQVHATARNLTINIPKGAKNGQRLRIPGGGKTLILTVEHLPHRLFRSEGIDLHLDLPVTPWEAALGTKITLPTLNGTLQMSIPAGSQGGQKLRLKGRGLPGKPNGDLYVHLQIRIPRAETAKAKDLYEQMKIEMPLNPRQDMGV